MKKVLVYVCCGIMVMGLAACGSKNNGSTGGSNPPQSTVEGNTPAQDANAGSGVQGAENGATTPEGGNDISEGWSEEMSMLRGVIVEELGDDYWPSMQIPPEYLEMTYGLSSDMYEDYMGEMPLMSAHVDTLLIVKAKAGQAETVEKTLQAYHKSVVENLNQYPMNLGKVQASQVERIGDYVCFVMLGGNTDAVIEQGDEAVIRHCMEQNQRVIELITENVNQ